MNAENTKLQQKTIEEQQKENIRNRYDNALVRLASDSGATSINGMHELYSLAREYPKEYPARVCDVFCRHIRNWTEEEVYKKSNPKEPAKKIQQMLNFLTKEQDGKPPPFDSRSIKLSEAFLNGANLWGAQLMGANLNRARLMGANLEDAE